jgi:hypothetical protein
MAIPPLLGQRNPLAKNEIEGAIDKFLPSQRSTSGVRRHRNEAPKLSRHLGR